MVQHLFNVTEMYPSPDLGLNYNPVLEVYRQLLRLLDWFVLQYKLSTRGPHIDRCIPFQIMSN